ncbi:hypothetical protein GCM10007857_02730 [Bradyrhizobium iriomotense]|uniref:Uncharacterized protein n=1 Tax=Bradyrhizobium iriomotense TaxID=441950 RepID=A0ABQ6AMV0_9BRAD|nr:hypothetical protein GCM10007857_02730 [Bradyrhizobium iriomotense]
MPSPNGKHHMRKMIAAMVLALAFAHPAGPLGLTLAFADDAVASPRSTTAATAPAPTTTPAPADAPVAPSHPQGPLERNCTTLGGKTFKWSFPNVPFGVARCS